MAPRKKLSREEQLKKKRDTEKKRQEKIKCNPELLLAEKIKRKQKYENRKKKGQLKPIAEKTHREKRQQRKSWRDTQRRHRERKKKAEEESRFLSNNSPPSSDSENIIGELPARELTNCLTRSKTQQLTNDDSPSSSLTVASTSCAKVDGRTNSGKRKRRKELQKLKKKLREGEKKAARYRKRYQRLLAKIKCDKKNATPRSKVNGFLKGRKVDKDVKRKLVFGEVLVSQLTHNYNQIKSHKTKDNVKRVIAGRIVKKYRCMTNVFKFLRNRRKNIEEKKIRIKSTEMAKQAVIDFLTQDENSTQCPGKKDVITRCKEKKQKRYLNSSLKELYAKFKNLDLNTRLSYTTFCRFKPFWIVARNVNSRDTCLCLTHSNMEMLTEKLHISDVVNTKKPDEIMEMLCCEKNSEKCLLRKCDKCKDQVIIYKEFNSADSIVYHKWVTTKETRVVQGNEKVFQITSKTEIKTDIGSAVDELESTIVKFMNHVANIHHQHQYIKDLKENISIEEALFHVDFSENFSAKYSEEVQAIHFGASRRQFTLHTGVAYYKAEDMGKQFFSFCTLSDSLRHDPAAIWAHLDPVVKYLLQKCPQIKIVHFLSDSPSTQYRNKKNFYLFQSVVERYPLVTMATWNFSEAGHGKGAPDGVGGCLKRTADNIVAQGTDITTLPTLFNKLEEYCPNIKLWKISENDILKFDEILHKGGKLVTVKGTMKVHQVTVTSKPSTHSYRTLSCLQCTPDQNCKHFGIAFSSDSPKSINLVKQGRPYVINFYIFFIVYY